MLPAHVCGYRKLCEIHELLELGPTCLEAGGEDASLSLAGLSGDVTDELRSALLLHKLRRADRPGRHC